MWQTLDFAGAVAARPHRRHPAGDRRGLGRPVPPHSICFNGIGCTGQGNRNLLDFFEVKLDSRGAAQVVYNDDANTLTALFPGGPFVTVGRQVGGASLYASVGNLGGTPTPDTAFQADPADDGFYPTSDTNVPSHATTVTTGSADTATGTIIINVPVTIVGGLSDGSRLLQATGFSLVERTAPAGINPGLADGADATPPFDDTLSLQPPLPEAPLAVLLLAIGATAALVVMRRRRLAGTPAP